MASSVQEWLVGAEEGRGSLVAWHLAEKTVAWLDGVARQGVGAAEARTALAYDDALALASLAWWEAM